jgi:epoxide hydrolase 4
MSSTTETSTSLATEAGLREGYADVGDVKLHYVETGDGPLVVLLHGFPEFWYGWRRQIAPLAAAGFRVVAADLRGYNLSSMPDGIVAYTADKLAADVRGLILERGAKSALVVGHDWGGTAAWRLAMNHPEVVERLAILDAAHPRKLNEGLKHPSQLKRSWYSSTSSCPEASLSGTCARRTGDSSRTSCVTPARRTHRKSLPGTSRTGRSQERRRR